MPPYLQFKVSLLDIEPPIWRRFLLRETATFNALSEAIQVAGPWKGYHLWQFCEFGRPRRVIAGRPRRELDIRAPDARRIRLKSYFTHFGDRCLYRYDFGDDWEHEVEYEQPVELDEAFTRRLLGGERAFPPDDCGGIPGLYECLLAVGEQPVRKDIGIVPSRKEIEDRREWLGDWTPEFDLEVARARFDR